MIRVLGGGDTGMGNGEGKVVKVAFTGAGKMDGPIQYNAEGNLALFARHRVHLEG